MAGFAQLPLQPRIARKIIVNLFNEKPLWLRADLAKAMLDKHLASGVDNGYTSARRHSKKGA